MTDNSNQNIGFSDKQKSELVEIMRDTINAVVPPIVERIIDEKVPPIVERIIEEKVPPIVERIVERAIEEKVPPIVERVVEPHFRAIHEDLTNHALKLDEHSDQLTDIQSDVTDTKDDVATIKRRQDQEQNQLDTYDKDLKTLKHHIAAR